LCEPRNIKYDVISKFFWLKYKKIDFFQQNLLNLEEDDLLPQDPWPWILYLKAWKVGAIACFEINITF